VTAALDDNDAVDTALGKGLRVLELLARSSGPLRLSQIAGDLGLQKSSTHRVLHQLIESGYVAQDEERGFYSSTLKVWELGSALVSSLPIKQAATSVLQGLHRATSETVSLTIRDGDDVLYLDKILAPRPIGFTTRVGSRIPAPLTASGRAMLAFEPDAAEVVARVAARLEPGTLDVDRALDDIRRARDEGYLVGRGRVERGVVGIATAVPGPGAGAAAGLTVSAPVQRLDDRRQAAIIEALLVAAAGLGEAIGRS
jgi:DNA-binding IclR family transcriptional regulator